MASLRQKLDVKGSADGIDRPTTRRALPGPVAGVPGRTAAEQALRSQGRREPLPRRVQHRILAGTYTPPEAGRVTVRSYSEEWTSRRTWAPATDRADRAGAAAAHPAEARRSAAGEPPQSPHRGVGQAAAAQGVERPNGVRDAVQHARRRRRRRAHPPQPAVGARLAKIEEVPFVPLEVDAGAIAERLA